MDNEFDRRQAEYWAENTNLRPSDHPVVRAFSQQRVQFIDRLLQSTNPQNALNIGCGDGFGMQMMQSIIKDIYGCDKSHKMLEANPANDVYLKQCDAYDLPYGDFQFDLVYSWELLHHIRHPEKVVEEMKRVSRKAVLLCEPNCLNPAMALFGLIKAEERGLLHFTPSYPSKLMRACGLTNIRHFSVGWFTPNRTPKWLANVFLKLPYHVPVVGMYTITVGWK